MNKNFLLIKANAGSGKTYSIVQHYISLLENNPDVSYFKSIMALTFTNKAANEMKAKILKEIEEISLGQRKDKKHLQEKFTKIYKKIIHNYSFFNIQTLDKFSKKIVNNFAYELDLPSEISTELNSKIYSKMVVENLIKKIGSDEDITEKLKNYWNAKFYDGSNWDFSLDLIKFCEELLNEESFNSLINIKNLEFETIKNKNDEINKFINDFKKDISYFITKLEQIFKENNIDLKKTNIFNGFYENLIELKEKTKIKDYDYFLLTKKRISEKIENGNFIKENVNDINEVLANYFEEYKNKIVENSSKIILYLNIKRNYFLISFLKIILEEMDNLQKTHKKIHISEYNKRISNVIIKERSIFIYEKIGNYIKHFIIDEFQDTSQIQWNNLLPLVENSLSEDKLVIIVGDPKQSIYRFRGAEINIIESLPNLYNPFNLETISLKENTKIFEQNLEIQHLPYNYRSSINIIEFNNNLYTYVDSIIQKIFKNNINNDNKKINLYKNVNQKLKTEEKGYVKVNFFNKDAYKDDQIIIIDKLIEDINILKAKNYPLNSITILVRFNKEIPKISNYLYSKNIPVFSSDSITLNSSDILLSFVSFIKLKLNPLNGIYKKEIIEFLKIEYQDKFEIKINKILYEDVTIISLFYLFLKEFEKLNILDPFQIYFINLLNDFNKENGFNLKLFLNQWDLSWSEKCITLNYRDNAINITTIHKSKGLEFENVILPFFNWKLYNNIENPIWLKNKTQFINEIDYLILDYNKSLTYTEYKDEYYNEKINKLIDNMNLIYVATTRAVKNMIIYTQENEKDVENIEDIKIVSEIILPYFKDKNIVDGCYEIGEIKENLNMVKMEKPTEAELIPYKNTVNNKIYEITNTLPFNDDILEFGIRFHKLISKIYYKDDWDYYFKKFTNEDFISEKDEYKGLYEDYWKFLANTEISNYLFAEGSKIYNEVEIYGNDGKRFRIDKLIINGNEVYIFDYKTGLSEGKDMEKHKKQIENYKDIIKEIYPDKTIKTFILYLSSKEVEMG